MMHSLRRKRPRRPRFGLLLVVLLAVAVGCGGSRDDRDEIRAQFGEPDDIVQTEGPYGDIEEWSYFDFEESGKTRFYRFERPRNSCGGDDNWSLTFSGDITPGEEIGSAEAPTDPKVGPSGGRP
jgi:hypothetical protein